MSEQSEFFPGESLRERLSRLNGGCDVGEVHAHYFVRPKPEGETEIEPRNITSQNGNARGAVKDQVVPFVAVFLVRDGRSPTMGTIFTWQ